MEPIAALEDYLRTARIIDVSAFAQHGAHKSFRVFLEGGVGALAKPATTAPDDGAAMVRYEVAGWVTARDLGWEDLVAATVLREMGELPGGQTEASIQVLWANFEPTGDLASLRDQDVWRAALYDALVFQTNRGGNWGVINCDGGWRVKLVDHGFAFRKWSGRSFESPFEQQKRGQHVPDELLEDMSRFLANCSQGELAGLLEADVLQQLCDRGRHIVTEGVLSFS